MSLRNMLLLGAFTLIMYWISTAETLPLWVQWAAAIGAIVGAVAIVFGGLFGVWRLFDNKLRGFKIILCETLNSTNHGTVLLAEPGKSQVCLDIRPRRDMLIRWIDPAFFNMSLAPYKAGKRIDVSTAAVVQREFWDGELFWEITKDKEGKWSRPKDIETNVSYTIRLTLDVRHEWHGFFSLQIGFTRDGNPSQRAVRIPVHFSNYSAPCL